MLRGKPGRQELDEIWDNFTKVAEERLLRIFDKSPEVKANTGRGQAPELEMQTAVLKKETLWRGASELAWACRRQADIAWELRRQLRSQIDKGDPAGGKLTAYTPRIPKRCSKGKPSTGFSRSCWHGTPGQEDRLDGGSPCRSTSVSSTSRGQLLWPLSSQGTPAMP